MKLESSAHGYVTEQMLRSELFTALRCLSVCASQFRLNSFTIYLFLICQPIKSEAAATLAL